MGIAFQMVTKGYRQVRTLAAQLGRAIPVQARSHRSASLLQVQLSDLTMVERRRFLDNVALIRRGRLVPGDLVECGVWRGGMSAAMAWAVRGRHSVLFDSFEGLPDPKSIDGPSALRWYNREHEQQAVLSAEEAWAMSAMKRVGQADFELIKGWFSDTVPAWAKKQRPIAVLRLDADWYDSTILCLEKLWPLVSSGGVIIIDDYYTWDGCSKAVHDYLSRIKAEERLETSGHGTAYIVRRPKSLTIPGRTLSGRGPAGF
jgi:O-methyltransferase